MIFENDFYGHVLPIVYEEASRGNVYTWAKDGKVYWRDKFKNEKWYIDLMRK
jgi:hypothetical protein